MIADKAHIAKVEFANNLSLFNKETEPEKYHLYSGLIALAEAFMEISTEMERVKREVRISKKH